jgi:hypothetical protein
MTAEVRRSNQSAFDFSAVEWDAIEDAVRQGCAQPWRFSRGTLRMFLGSYFEDWPHYSAPAERASSFRRAARAIKRARQAWAAADPSGTLDDLRLHGKQFRDLPPDLSSISQLFDHLERFTRAGGDPATWSRDRRHPRVALCWDVLFCWTLAGGALKYSRGKPGSDNAGRLGGPLIRYLNAVLNPVLRDQAPTLEGLRKIIDRYGPEILARNAEIDAAFDEVYGSAAQREL